MAGFEVAVAEVEATIADWLGIGRDSTDWSDEEQDRVTAYRKSGVRQFYWPPPLPGERTPHRWSFLRRVASLTTESGEEDYALAADFGSLCGDLYYNNNGARQIIERVPCGMILDLRARDRSAGAPQQAAVMIVTGDEGDDTVLSVVPESDAEYTIWYQYVILPESVDEAESYHLGGAMHAETLLQSCLAVAERRDLDDDNKGVQEAAWLQRLAASVAHDRANSPSRFGYNGDRSGTGREPFSRANFVTINGVLYDNR